MRSPLPITLALVAAASLCAVAVADDVQAPKVVTKQIAPGLTYTQEIGSTLTINVLIVDPTAPAVRVDTAIAVGSITAGTGDPAKGRDTVRALVDRCGALAGVNGDYFGGTGDPLGLGISQSELYSEPWTTPRAAFGLDISGQQPFFGVLSFTGDFSVDGKPGHANLSAINRPLSKADVPDLVVYSQLYGPYSGARQGAVELIVKGVNVPIQPNKEMVGTIDTVIPSSSGQSQIPDDGVVFSSTPHGPIADYLRTLAPGDSIRFSFAIAPVSELSDTARTIEMVSAALPAPTSRSAQLPRSALQWGSAFTAIGGGPKLLTDGRLDIDGAAEGFDAGFTDGAHARTAIGATAAGKLIVVAVEGKPGVCGGISLGDLASILQRYGAVNAINLDGGGSTSMAIRGLTVNYPNQGLGERRVADALLIRGTAPTAPIDSNAAIIVPSDPVQVGDTCSLTCRLYGTILDGFSSQIVWSGPATGGVGYVTQDGTFHALRPGKGNVTALCGSQRLTATISVVGIQAPSETFATILRLTDVDLQVNRSKVTVHITSSSGAPGAKIPVTVIVTGGTPDQSSLVTDEDGLASTLVTWTGQQGWITIVTPKTSAATISQNPQPVVKG